MPVALVMLWRAGPCAAQMFSCNRNALRSHSAYTEIDQGDREINSESECTSRSLAMPNALICSRTLLLFWLLVDSSREDRNQRQHI